MKKLFVTIGVILLLFSPFSVSAEQDERIPLIKEYVEEALEIHQIPGASLAIVENGETIYQEQWGKISDGSAVKADTSMLIGSMSKPITALAVMLLVEDGKIKLDEPIQTYLPSFKYQADSSTPITVWHLVEQTSGIRQSDGLKVTDEERESKGAMIEAVGELSGVTLSREPGEHYEYNSANYLLLGAIIEKVSQQTFSAFVEQRIFTPLGMIHAAADYETSVENGFVPGFESWFGKPKSSDGFYDHAGAPYGYMTSSASDLAKLLTFMLEGGDLLSEASLDLIKALPGDGKTYGYGWHFSKEEHFPFHGGATPHFRGEMFFIPEKDYGAVLLTNKYHFTEDAQVSQVMKGIRSIMDGSAPTPLTVQSPAIQWSIVLVLVLLALLTLFQFFRLKRKKELNQKRWFITGSIVLLLSLGFIPVFSSIMRTPWKSVKLFAPDIALLIDCLIVILALNGAMTLVITWRKGVRERV
ncbi:serine hydrolase domain-containing protein [Bacillus tuaregi]|uniref:serine hydrolase domain-containing protein n=1 Tax=Bacillus tuaregi TaxID=1816695 RepID=UPI0008F95CC9|nr:serine hydrolase domain-containing protein [Bacillus tuaregi]